jgi:hypothetical protein
MAANSWRLGRIFMRKFVVDFVVGVRIAAVGSRRHATLVLQLRNVMEAWWVVEQEVARVGPTTTTRSCGLPLALRWPRLV